MKKPNKKLSTKFKKMFNKHLSELNRSNKEIDSIISSILAKMNSENLSVEEYNKIFGISSQSQSVNINSILNLKNNMARIDSLFGEL